MVLQRPTALRGRHQIAKPQPCQGVKLGQRAQQHQRLALLHQIGERGFVVGKVDEGFVDDHQGVAAPGRRHQRFHVASGKARAGGIVGATHKHQIDKRKARRERLDVQPEVISAELHPLDLDIVESACPGVFAEGRLDDQGAGATIGPGHQVDRLGAAIGQHQRRRRYPQRRRQGRQGVSVLGVGIVTHLAHGAGEPIRKPGRRAQRVETGAHIHGRRHR